jgi:hypothetical protein
MPYYSEFDPEHRILRVILEGEQCPPKPVLHRVLSFARLRFHGLGGGKFPISVWLGARGTRVQFTSLLVGCTPSRTRYG